MNIPMKPEMQGKKDMEVNAIVCLLLICISNADLITIQTNLGDIIGSAVRVDNETVYQFKGIPYALPPVGDLRFKPPVPFEPFNHTFNATTFGTVCAQLSSYYSSRFLYSEDCLFLNIYVPRDVTKGNNKTVMIWVHGGGYIGGTGNVFDGSLISLRGDVIVVTFNYRLAVFGFLSTGDSASPGNYGLMDQRLVFKWVKQNIEAFGGNPNSVTIFGDSAGGTSVGLHALNPNNRGLFHRIIQESGVGNSFVAYDRNFRQLATFIIQSFCGNYNSTLLQVQCLRTKSTPFLSISENNFNRIYRKKLWLSVLAGPVIDGDLVLDDPIKLLSNKSSDSYKFFKSLDVMVGTVSGEGSLLIDPLKYLQSDLNFNLTEGIPSRILCCYLAPAAASDFYNNNSNTAEAICDKYRIKKTADADAEQGRQVIDMFGDAMFLSPAVQNVLVHSGKNNITNTYVYYFTVKDSERTVPWFSGAEHGSEVKYLFRTHNNELPEEYLELSDDMLLYWTNFAKTGNPNANSLPAWPKFDENKKNYLILDKNITAASNLFPDRVKFWLQDIVQVPYSKNISLPAECHIKSTSVASPTVITTVPKDQTTGTTGYISSSPKIISDGSVHIYLVIIYHAVLNLH